MAQKSKDASYPELRVSSLGRSHGLPHGDASSYREKASFCLDSCNHGLKCVLSVTGSYNEKFFLVRSRINNHKRTYYGRTPKATEDGACGIAILLVVHLTGLAVERHSSIDTGYDYYLVSPDAFLFQDSMPLEVVGIRRDPSGSRIRSELADREERFKRYKVARGLIAVIEFGQPRAHVVRHEQE